MAPDQEDAGILATRAEGDAADVARLLEWCRPHLARIVDSRLGPKLRQQIEVADVVQETLTQALRSAEKLHGKTREEWILWLRAVAENVMRKSARTGRRSPLLYVTRDVPGVGISPSRAARREERFGRLQKVLSELTPEQRDIVRLVRIEGLKMREVAARTGRTIGAVKQLMLRALQKMRARLPDTDSLHLPDRALDFGERDDDQKR